MATKPKGNIFYEICVVVLIVGLIATILYPSRVWRTESEFESICQNRMETIRNLEYMYLPKGNVYTANISEMIDSALTDLGATAALDTLIFWDGLVTKKDLKQIIFQKQFPEDLRNYIFTRLQAGMPLGNLGVWDSLNYRLVDDFQTIFTASSTAGSDVIDGNIAWPVLVGDMEFQNILNSSEISQSIRRRIASDMRRGRGVFETQDWKQFRPKFYTSLSTLLATAERKDVWEEADKDRWEKEAHVQWKSEMDALPQVERDSLWLELQQRFWDKEKELMWKRERDRLWKVEGADWQRTNEAMWKRGLTQQWTAERKKNWEDETLAALPDSLKGSFKTEKDSVWKNVVDELQTAEYDAWEKANMRAVNELIHNLWERDRRVTWEADAHQMWVAEKESDKDELWGEIKEEQWNLGRDRLWREEGEKLAYKASAMRRLDKAIKWMNVLGAERISSIVNALQLPDNESVWRKIEKRKEEKGSILFGMGIAGLFREVLLDSIITCPLACTPYLIQTVDTSVIRQFSVRCPIIIDSAGVAAALKFDAVTGDSTEIALKMPALRKILGGGTIKNHGYVDQEMKSWEKKER